MNYSFEISKLESQRVVSIRTRTPVDNLSNTLGGIYDSVVKYLSEENEQPAGAPFVAYYNIDMKDLDIEAGFPVTKILNGKGEVKLSEIPEGRYLSCIYKGPYNKIEDAYNAIMRCIEENKYDTTGVCYEYYLNDPENTPQDELLTKISYELK